MSIEFVIPSMRPIMVKRVLHDLNHQTLKPNRVVLVDNSTRFINGEQYDYEFEVVRPGKNIGTNPVWNLALRFKSDYCGILGDDYRLEPQMVEKLLFGLFLVYRDRRTGATVPEIIQQRRRKVINHKYTPVNQIRGVPIDTGKGQCSAVLMSREVARKIPLIPDHFKIFFGDNWIGYHIINTLKMNFVRMFPCYIYHIPGPTNVSASLNYKGTLKHERKFWKQYVREQQA